MDRKAKQDLSKSVNQMLVKYSSLQRRVRGVAIVYFYVCKFWAIIECTLTNTRDAIRNVDAR